MSFESFIGLRYLRAQRSSAFLSTITLICVGGVAVGVCALIVVLSVMAGFEDELRDQIIGHKAHGSLLKTDDLPFGDYRELLEKMDSTPGVVGAMPYLKQEVMVSSDENVTGAVLKGIDLARVDRVSKLPEQFIAGDLVDLKDPERLMEEARRNIENKIKQGLLLPEWTGRTKKRLGNKALPGIVIGKEMAGYLGVSVGDELNVVNPLGGGIGPMGPIPSNEYFRVAGVFFTGMFEYDMKFAYTTIPALQTFSSMEDEISAIEFKVEEEKLFETEEIGQAILAGIGGDSFKIMDWKMMNRSLFSALQLEQFAMFIILTFITLVAAFNIASTLIMMVIEKGQEIAILKSMGADRRAIMRIFMLDGLIIGAIGTFIGAILGFFICWMIPFVDLRLDPEVYYMTSIPVQVKSIQVEAILLSALLISWLATIYPAWQASGLKPVDGLRYD